MLAAWVRVYVYVCHDKSVPYVCIYLSKRVDVHVCIYVHTFVYVPHGVFLCVSRIYSVETDSLSVCEREE